MMLLAFPAGFLQHFLWTVSPPAQRPPSASWIPESSALSSQAAEWTAAAA